MPTSKQARARQARQKERLAVLHAERHQKSLRRRKIGVAGGALVVVVGILLAVFIGPSSGGGTKAASPTTNPSTPPTTAVTTAAGPTKCVAVKGPFPKGAPAFPNTAGPAPTKLVTKDLKIGTGAVVPQGSKVTVKYIGAQCSDGKVFDSSYASNDTFDADLAGGVIPGWQQGLPGMKVGGRRLLSIPASLAYGASGNGDIGPNEPLFFVVDVVKV